MQMGVFQMSFKLPEKTKWMREQMEHEPTRAYAEDMYNLAQRFPFKKGLEIGCMWGVSTLALLLGGQGELTSVDKSDWTHAPEETEANGIDRWGFVNLDSKDFWERNKEKYDLVYVDGSHTYEYAHLDIGEGWKVLESGGVLAVDDVIHKNNRPGEPDPYGVAIAAWEHVYNNTDICDMGFEGRILWFKKC